MIQWSGLWASTAGAAGSAPSWETKIPQAAVYIIKVKKIKQRASEGCAQEGIYTLNSSMLLAKTFWVPGDTVPAPKKGKLGQLVYPE